MAKIILWIVIVFAVLMVLRLVNAEKTRRRRNASRSSAAAQPMIRCAACGVYVPQNDAKPGRLGPTCGDPVCLSR